MNQSTHQPEIYFHVGLGKVASTYLQHRFFPRLKGIHYIKSTRYRRSPQIIKDTNYDKYFISREFDRASVVSPWLAIACASSVEALSCS